MIVITDLCKQLFGKIYNSYYLRSPKSVKHVNIKLFRHRHFKELFMAVNIRHENKNQFCNHSLTAIILIKITNSYSNYAFNHIDIKKIYFYAFHAIITIN